MTAELDGRDLRRQRCRVVEGVEEMRLGEERKGASLWACPFLFPVHQGYLETAAAAIEEQEEDDQQQDDADAASAIVADAGAHVVAAAAEEQDEDDEDQK